MHYSSRLGCPPVLNAYSQLIAAKRAAGCALLDLSVSNPTQTLPHYPHAAIAQALSALSDLTYSPDPFGSPQARSAVAHYYRDRGVNVSTSRIALTASTSESYSLLFKLFCDPGDQVLVPIPSYPLFEYLARLETVNIVPYRLQYDGVWHIDLEHLASRISRATRAIVVVSPNNPTGSFLKDFEVRRLFDLAIAHSIPVIADEVFLDYRVAADPSAVATFTAMESALSISLNGLSKAAAMPQMKLGWLVVNGPPQDVETVRARLELLLDTYLSVNTPVQCALPGLLQIGTRLRQELLATIHKNIDRASALLTGSPIRQLRIEGGWTAILQLPRLLPEEEWIMSLLESYSVVVQPGYFFDMLSEAYVVVSLITPPDVFGAGLERLRDFAARQSRA